VRFLDAKHVSHCNHPHRESTKYTCNLFFTKILVAFGSLFVAALALMGFIIYNHKYLMKLVMFSSINMSAYTACILILVALDLKFISAPTLTCSIYFLIQLLYRLSSQ